MNNATLLAAARAWLAQDPDPLTRQSLMELVAACSRGDGIACAELADAFRDRLSFGTAGLRGALGPGPNRMNRVVVQQAAAGLASYLGGRGGVVIGYDARHKSDVFARDSAGVFSGAGCSAMVLPDPMPTPVLAFAVRDLGCAAGVMVTASHNPPQDNGYKVYLGDGCQIVPPADSEISACIEAAANLPLDELPHGDDWITLGHDVLDRYIAVAHNLVDPKTPRDIRIVHTAMHGVGGSVLERVLHETGFPAPIRVVEQHDPDPDFPTVAFPNPEEPGAMDLALATARRVDADIVIANDPDADRCAIAIRDGEWRMLTGDEVGILLAWWIAQRAPKHGVMAQSLVSCSLLEALATDYGFEYQRTLTGFKWIGRIPNLVFGYEEALGYCVDPVHVHDKDGITAALLIAELAAWCKAHGRTLQDILDDIARRYGVYATRQVSLRVTDLAQITAIMADLRERPPDQVGSLSVQAVIDLADGAWGLPPTDGIWLGLDGGARIIIRPSGTEPKIKAYLQAVVEDVADLVEARAQATRTLDALQADVLGWFT